MYSFFSYILIYSVNVQLVVKEIGLINTVFLKDNNETVNCLNSVLVTKSISNLSRSSELVETLEIHVSSTTSSETISAVKLKLDEYVIQLYFHVRNFRFLMHISLPLIIAASFMLIL